MRWRPGNKWLPKTPEFEGLSGPEDGAEVGSLFVNSNAVAGSLRVNSKHVAGSLTGSSRHSSMEESDDVEMRRSTRSNIGTIFSLGLYMHKKQQRINLGHKFHTHTP